MKRILSIVLCITMMVLYAALLPCNAESTDSWVLT